MRQVHNLYLAFMLVLGVLIGYASTSACQSVPTPMDQEIAREEGLGQITHAQAEQLRQASRDTATPQWLTIIGSLVGAVGTAFLGVKVAKNGMQSALTGAQALAQSAHDRLDNLPTKGT